MRHFVEIWTKDKEGHINIRRDRVIITEADIEELAVRKFKEENSTDDNIQYTAQIDKTEISLPQKQTLKIK